MSTYVNTVNQTEIFVEGRGDMGSTPVFSKTDLLVSHEMPMAGNKRLRVELNVLELFNQKTARHVFNYLNRGAGAARASSAIDLHNNDLFKGYDYNAMISEFPMARTRTIRATAWKTCSKRHAGTGIGEIPVLGSSGSLSSSVRSVRGEHRAPLFLDHEILQDEATELRAGV